MLRSFFKNLSICRIAVWILLIEGLSAYSQAALAGARVAEEEEARTAIIIGTHEFAGLAGRMADFLAERDFSVRREFNISSEEQMVDVINDTFVGNPPLALLYFGGDTDKIGVPRSKMGTWITFLAKKLRSRSERVILIFDSCTDDHISPPPENTLVILSQWRQKCPEEEQSNSNFVNALIRNLSEPGLQPERAAKLALTQGLVFGYSDAEPIIPAAARREDVQRDFAAAQRAGTCEAFDAVVAKYTRGYSIAEEEVQDAQILSEHCKRDRSIRAFMNKGKNYALIIGEQNYGDPTYRPLETPLADAEAVAAILRERYGFTTEFTTKDGTSTKNLYLLDRSKKEIVDILTYLSLNLSEDDRLVIYYAGHGQQDKRTAGTYWIPVDAHADQDVFDWIPAHDIIERLKLARARSILVVSDSCFSGGLFRESRGEPTDADLENSLAKDAKKRSRVLISSGGLYPVLDGGGGGHSIFARKFLEVLNYSKESVFSAAALHKKVKAMVSHVKQVPQYHLLDEDDDSGDFVFVANEVTDASAR